MKRCRKLTAVFMMSVFSLSALTLTASAVEGEGDAGGDAGAVVEDPVTPDPVTPESGYGGDDSSYSDDGGVDGYSSSGNGGSSYYGDNDYFSSSSSVQSYDNQGNDGGYSDYSSSYYGGYSSSSSSYYGGYNYESSGYDNYSQSYDDSYQSSEASLIESESNVDEDVLSSNDWSDIAKSLNSANTSTGSNDADDFSFIKNNTSTGDNGQWMFYVALSMIVVSLLGITYFVGSTVLSRKKAANRVKAAAASHGAYPQRTRSSYDDGYGASNQKRGKYDTAEIRIPKNGSSGGRRYR